MKKIQAWVTPGVTQAPNKYKAPNECYKKIIEVICLHYNLSFTTIFKKSRREDIIYARQVFCYFMKEVYGDRITPSIIADLINKERTTVINAIERFENMLYTDSLLPLRVGIGRTKQDYEDIRKKLMTCL